MAPTIVSRLPTSYRWTLTLVSKRTAHILTIQQSRLTAATRFSFRTLPTGRAVCNPTATIKSGSLASTSQIGEGRSQIGLASHDNSLQAARDCLDGCRRNRWGPV